jgi:hypothetical protein
MKAALVGLLGGFVVVMAVTAIDFVRVESWTTCEFQCYWGVDVGNVLYIGSTFLIGFAAAFAWFLRRRRLSPE